MSLDVALHRDKPPRRPRPALRNPDRRRRVGATHGRQARPARVPVPRHRRRAPPLPVRRAPARRAAGRRPSPSSGTPSVAPTRYRRPSSRRSDPTSVAFWANSREPSFRSGSGRRTMVGMHTPPHPGRIHAATPRTTHRRSKHGTPAARRHAAWSGLGPRHARPSRRDGPRRSRPVAIRAGRRRPCACANMTEDPLALQLLALTMHEGRRGAPWCQGTRSLTPLIIQSR